MDRDYETMVRDVVEDTDGPIRINAAPLMGEDGDRSTPLGLRFEPDDGPPAFHPITHLQIDGAKHIRVREVTLMRQRLAGVDARYGGYQVGDDQHTLVITTTSSGEHATLRVRTGEAGAPTDYELHNRLALSADPADESGDHQSPAHGAT